METLIPDWNPHKGKILTDAETLCLRLFFYVQRIWLSYVEGDKSKLPIAEKKQSSIFSLCWVFPLQGLFHILFINKTELIRNSSFTYSGFFIASLCATRSRSYKLFFFVNKEFLRFFATKLGCFTVHTFFSYATNFQA